MEEHVTEEQCLLVAWRQKSEIVAGEVWGEVHIREWQVKNTTKQVILCMGQRHSAHYLVRVSSAYLHLQSKREKKVTWVLWCVQLPRIRYNMYLLARFHEEANKDGCVKGNGRGWMPLRRMHKHGVCKHTRGWLRGVCKFRSCAGLVPLVTYSVNIVQTMGSSPPPTKKIKDIEDLLSKK